MIRRLAPDVVARVRTGVTATTVAQCAEELLMNAVDAGATQITLRVNLESFGLQVRDNGRGISQEDLRTVGQRYCTSKCHDVASLARLQHYGFRGEALASLQDVGILDVVTRERLSTQTHAKVMKAGRTLSLGQAKTPLSASGSVITVHDLFYNLPIRRKAMQAQLELDQIKGKVAVLALANPQVSFTLVNGANNARLLRTRGGSDSVAAVFQQLFGHARRQALRPVGRCHGPFRVVGFAAVAGHHNQSIQFLFVNNRPVYNTPLHKLVNGVLARSDICRRMGGIRPDRELGGTVGQALSRAAPRFGVYCLNLSCATDQYDICLEPTKTLVEFKNWEAAKRCVEGAVRLFLEENDLCEPEQQAAVAAGAGGDQAGDGLPAWLTPTPRSTVGDKTVPAPTAALATSPARRHLLDFAYTAPSGRSGLESRAISRKRRRTSPAPVNASAAAPPPTVADSTDTRAGEEPRRDLTPEPAPPQLGQRTAVVVPRAPSTPQAVSLSAFSVDKVFGAAGDDEAAPNCAAAPAPALAGENSSVPSPGSPATVQDEADALFADDDAADDGAGDTARIRREAKWRPVDCEVDVAAGRKQVRGIVDDALDADGALLLAMRGLPRGPQGHTLQGAKQSTPLRFSKQCFSRLTVIRQVDRKYIACRLAPEDAAKGTMLVCIDQHAADERIQLERMLQNLHRDEDGYHLVGIELTPPLTIRLHAREARILAQSPRAFERWGVRFGRLDVPPESLGPGGEHDVQVLSVSKPFVHVGCQGPAARGGLVYGKALVSFIRERLDTLQQTSGGARHHLPGTITRILHSKACHSAIKFGDALTQAQCEELVRDLSKCQLPFQCAHGRPAMAPIADLGCLEPTKGPEAAHGAAGRGKVVAPGLRRWVRTLNQHREARAAAQVNH